MFRKGEAKAGRELDGAITETKASRAQALKELGHESRRRQMVIDFSGEEQSATQTRAFMTHFRVLANAGATVLILHHTGKTPSSQDYRGSSDIKAAVDMAYCVEPEFTLLGCIHRLTMRNFKGRFAPGRHLGLEFVPKKGFVACEVPDQPTARDAMQTVVEIVAAHPRSINRRS